MATTSVMTPFGGGSGYDLNTSLQEIAVNNLLGNYFSGLVGNYFGKKSAKQSMYNQMQLASWQALNMPKLQRQGLEQAGINPLLAYHSGISSQSLPSAYQTFHSMPNLGSNSVGSVSNTSYKGMLEKQELKAATAEAEAIEAESNARTSRAFLDELDSTAMIAAMTGRKMYTKQEGEKSIYETERYDKFIEKLTNEIDSSAYQNSVMRRVLFDAFDLSQKGADIFSTIKSPVKNVNHYLKGKSKD